MLTRLTLFLIGLICLSLAGYAQTKRALIIGINDYYSRDTKTNTIQHDRRNSLKGCVNDALSVKELILSRFGFSQTNIRELYNEQATKKNILSELEKLLTVCKAGDNAFLYYAGHGLQVDNASGNGTDEAIAPTDVLYQNNGFILSLQLAAIFNKFVDKKVTLTTIFDCCHSWGTQEIVVQQGQHYEIEKHSNVGSGRLNPDFRSGAGEQQFELFTIDEPLYSDGDLSEEGSEIRELDFSEYKFYTENLTDTIYQWNETEERNMNELRKDKGAAVASKLTGKIVLPKGPALRINSNFLFMSATNDEQKAVERLDENKTKRGVFTKALLEVFKKNPASLTSQQVFDKLKTELIKRNFKQTPTLRCAPERKTKNLLAVTPATLRNTVLTKCSGFSEGMLKFDKGAMAGLSRGNILQDIANPALRIELSEVNNGNAYAAYPKGTSLLKGKTFKVSSWHTKSDPVLNVYLPEKSFTFSQLYQYVNSRLKPLLDNQKYAGGYSGSGYYVPFENNCKQCSKFFITPDSIVFIDGKTHQQKSLNTLTKSNLQELNQNRAYFIYLPLMTEVRKALETLIKKDQNLQLVDDPAKADVSFYCAYTEKLQKDKDIEEKPDKIVPALTPELFTNPDFNPYGPFFPELPATSPTSGSFNLVIAYSKETVGENLYATQHKPLAPFLFIKNGTIYTAEALAKKMYTWLLYTAGQRGIWLNDWVKK
jgi:hypothetical protein